MQHALGDRRTTADHPAVVHGRQVKRLAEAPSIIVVDLQSRQPTVLQRCKAQDIWRQLGSLADDGFPAQPGAGC